LFLVYYYILLRREEVGDMEILLKAEDKSEILRFLEYRGQEMDEELSKQIDRCMEIYDRTIYLWYGI